MVAVKDVAGDIGNNSVKMYLELRKEGVDYINVPSVIKRLPKLPEVKDNDIKSSMATLLDNLTVHISSNAIKRDGVYYVGSIAQNKERPQNMDIEIGMKHKDDVVGVMTLSLIAAQLVKNEYDATDTLPTDIKETLKYSCAIPASQYNVERRDYLIDRFKENHHLITLFIAGKKVQVTLTFDEVKVTAEGVPPLYALVTSPQDILEDFLKEYKEEAIEPSHFAKKRIFHMDIGSGTVEYIYTEGLKAIFSASTGAREGVGHAMTDAIEIFAEKHNEAEKLTRQDFDAILRNKDDHRHEYALECMEEASFDQCERILTSAKKNYIEKVKGRAEYICVYGGGSIEFKSYLYNELLEFAKEQNCKLLWIPAKYAVNMNAKGLNVLNRNVFFKKAKQKNAEAI